MDTLPPQFEETPRRSHLLRNILIVFGSAVVLLVIVVIVVISRSGGVQSFLAAQEREELKLTLSQVRTQAPALYRVADVVTDSDPRFGDPKARLIIVEFGDFECPFCRQAFPVIREIMTKYQDRILFIYRDYLNPAHTFAQKAAEAGECAWVEDPKKFWALHDKMYQNQEDLSVPALKSYATSVGIDGTRFEACLDSGKFAAEAQEDFQTAVRLGVPGTPTWFIVFGDQVRMIPGVQPFGFWEELIEGLATKEPAPAATP